MDFHLPSARRTDRDHRAIAGLSMGAYQALQIALRNMNDSAYVGAISSGLFHSGVHDLKAIDGGPLADADTLNGRMRLLWMGLGTAEPPEISENVKLFHRTLTEAGIRHVYYGSPGTAHEWLTGRRSLREFAPMLFQGSEAR